MQEKEYLYLKYLNDKHYTNKAKDLKKYIAKLNEQINTLKASIDLKILNQSQLINKRESLQNQISQYNNQPVGTALNLTYQYYIITLNNLSLDQKKNQNVNELKMNEMKISKYINQIKARDEAIKNVDNELRKRNISIKVGEDIKTLSEINIEQSIILPNINTSNKFEESKSANVNLPPSKNARSSSPKPRVLNYNEYSHPYIIKEKKKFKTKTTEIIEKTKRNQLTNIRLNLINEMYPNSKIKYTNPTQVVSHNDKVIEFKASNFIKDKNNTSMTSNHTSHSQSRLERELDKKNKYILNKHVNRYKNSPYVKKI